MSSAPQVHKGQPTQAQIEKALAIAEAAGLRHGPYCYTQTTGNLCVCDAARRIQALTAAIAAALADEAQQGQRWKDAWPRNSRTEDEPMTREALMALIEQVESALQTYDAGVKSANTAYGDSRGVTYLRTIPAGIRGGKYEPVQVVGVLYDLRQCVAALRTLAASPVIVDPIATRIIAGMTDVERNTQVMEQAREVPPAKGLNPICGKCLNVVERVYAAPCPEPEPHKGGSIGMYPCPNCQTVLLAGSSHPPMCRECLLGRAGSLTAMKSR